MSNTRKTQQQLPWPWEIIHDISLILGQFYNVDPIKPPENPLRRIVFAAELAAPKGSMGEASLPKMRFIDTIKKTIDRIEKRPPPKPEHSWWLIAHDLWKTARKYAPKDSPHRRMRHHLAPKTNRGRQWLGHHSQQFLTPCARLVSDELCLRAGHNAWGIPFEEALKQNKVKFPWAYGGIESLIDSLPLHNGRAGELVPYGERQIRNGLKQLEKENRIKQFFRAFEGQGASRFWVFFTLKMSNTFKHLSKRNKALKALTDLQTKFKQGSKTSGHKPPVSLADRRLKLKQQAEQIQREHPEDWKPPKKPS